MARHGYGPKNALRDNWIISSWMKPDRCRSLRCSLPHGLPKILSCSAIHNNSNNHRKAHTRRGSDVAALTYLLEGHPTMPEGKGLFLGITRRLHPAICEFTSELFYEGKLHSLPGLENQIISGNTPFDGAGLFYVPVVHKGNQSKSKEEVDAIGDVVSKLLATGKWTDKDRHTRSLEKKDILIVAPFNAQVSALREKLPGIEIGTVDKFQGQEAPVVIYSMTSSTVDDAPRGMNFLFSPNRLNVATSRARSICVLVANPGLLQPDCRTIDQMRWANALCRYVELSRNELFDFRTLTEESR